MRARADLARARESTHATNGPCVVSREPYQSPIMRRLLVSSLLAMAVSVVSSGCAENAQSAVPPGVALASPTGPVDARAFVAHAPFTVFNFHSHHCPCVAAHDARRRFAL